MRLRLEAVSKRFGLEHALTRVSLELRAGQRLTILGTKGAGKSTLAAILAGEQKPDDGKLWLEGHRFHPRGLYDARKAGVCIAGRSWELPLHLTVEQALTLGMEPERSGWINRTRRQEMALDALVRLKSDDIPLGLLLTELPENQRKRVTLARALMGRPSVIVMDEPGPLSEYDTDILFSVLQERAAEGAAILLLSRSVEEARELGGRIAILREGRLLPQLYPAQSDPAEIVSVVEGIRGDETLGPLPRRHRLGEVVLAVHEISGASFEGPVSLRLREGEILGLAGVSGAGRSALLAAIAGVEPTFSGEIHLAGRAIGGWSLRRRMRAGLALVGESWVMGALSVSDNLFLPSARRGDRATVIARDWMEKLRIRPGGTQLCAMNLARANRWKVALARAVRQGAKVLLVEDFSAELTAPLRREIYGWLIELASEGRAIIMVGSVLPELVAVCDRIAVMRRGSFREIKEARAWSCNLDQLASAVAGEVKPRYQPSTSL